MLCKLCQEIFRGSFLEKLKTSPDSANDPATNILHHSNFPDFIKAARYCGICFTLMWCLNERDETRLWHSDPVKKVSLTYNISYKTCDNAKASDHLLLTFYGSVEAELHGSSGLLKSFLLKAQKSQPSPYLDCSSPIQSLLDIGKLVSQYQKCRNLHSTCQTGSLAPVVLPTRLVAVGLHGDAFVRLVETHTMSGQRIHYATLSHRWSSTRVVVLTPENLSQMKSEIRMNSLPNAFQEAVYLTRALGLSYLWIDSLCIVQTDPGRMDWKKESPKMSDYYLNAQINLASIENVSTLYTELEIPLFKHGRYAIKSSWKDGPNGNYNLTTYSEYWSKRIENQQLLSRAWVLQERIFATRMLYFGEQEYFWECYNHVTWESIDSSCDCRSFYTGRHINILSHTALQRSRIPRHREWIETVQSYTRCTLTYSSDIFAAISGLAKYYQALTKHEYVAGLWRENLLHGLLWRVEVPGNRIPDSISPSWSWASTDSSVSFHHFSDFNLGENIKFLAKIVHADGTDFHGRLLKGAQGQRAVLAAQGHTVKVVPKSQVPIYRDLYNFCAWPDDSAQTSPIHGTMTINPDCKTELSLGQEYYFLPLRLEFFQDESYEPGEKSMDLVGILLTSLPEENVYKRIGWANPDEVGFTTFALLYKTLPGLFKDFDTRSLLDLRSLKRLHSHYNEQYAKSGQIIRIL